MKSCKGMATKKDLKNMKEKIKREDKKEDEKSYAKKPMRKRK